MRDKLRFSININEIGHHYLIEANLVDEFGCFSNYEVEADIIEELGECFPDLLTSNIFKSTWEFFRVMSYDLKSIIRLKIFILEMFGEETGDEHHQLHALSA